MPRLRFYTAASLRNSFSFFLFFVLNARLRMGVRVLIQKVRSGMTNKRSQRCFSICISFLRRTEKESGSHNSSKKQHLKSTE
jgi:hypothetical protein